jgi:hypothetical protein
MFKPKDLTQTPNDSLLGSPSFAAGDLLDFVDAKTGRHALDLILNRRRPIVIRVERNVLSLAELERECRVLLH